MSEPKEQSSQETISSKLLPREQYFERMIEVGPLYSWEFEKNGQLLFYFGANHSADPANEQYPKLREFWVKFLKTTEDKKRLAIVEGSLPEPSATEEDAIRRGSEGHLIARLAHDSNVEVVCPDVQPIDIEPALLEKFSLDQIAYYDFALAVHHWRNHAGSKRDLFPKFIERFLGTLKTKGRRDPWKDFDFSLEHFKEIHRSIFGVEFDENTPDRITDPNRSDSIINQVARASSDVRDKHIIEEIERYWKNGKSLFIVLGSGHGVIQEPALLELVK